MDILLKLIKGEKITDVDLTVELYEICDRVHANCDDECPVYLLNGHSPPGSDKLFHENRGCDCFKNGPKMLRFIKENK